MKPLPTSLALSATVVLFYSLCALAEVTWLDQFMRFMNALFHGFDFRKLVTIATCNWSSFLYALPILAVLAFAAGASFARVHNALSSLQGRHVMRYE